ncbi:MAG: hypothetical protein WCF56_00940, partial [Pseudolabrys sp.]
MVALAAGSSGRSTEISCQTKITTVMLRAVGGLVAETMCYALNRYYGANIDAHWYIGQYVLPGNIQKIILKPKTLGPLRII